MPRVTVMIATYNWATVLPYSIGSVLDQTYRDFELLVTGDGCTDESAEVVGRFDDPPRPVAQPRAESRAPVRAEQRRPRARERRDHRLPGPRRPVAPQPPRGARRRGRPRRARRARYRAAGRTRRGAGPLAGHRLGLRARPVDPADVGRARPFARPRRRRLAATVGDGHPRPRDRSLAAHGRGRRPAALGAPAHVREAAGREAPRRVPRPAAPRAGGVAAPDPELRRSRSATSPTCTGSHRWACAHRPAASSTASARPSRCGRACANSACCDPDPTLETAEDRRVANRTFKGLD